MTEFQFKTAIPTSSDANGLICDKNTYFASNSHLFTLRNGNYSHVCSCDGTIKAIAVLGLYSLLCTADRVYLNSGKNLIGSLRRSASAIDVYEEFFAIAVDNVLEVWKIPKEYKFTLFTQHSKNIGHYKKITHIKIISATEILTASEDCTVRIFDIEKKTTKIIASLSSIPKGLHYDSKAGNVVVACSNGSVTSVELGSKDYKNFKDYKNLKLEGNISASASVDDIWTVSLENMVIEKAGEEALFPVASKPEKQEISNKTMLLIFRGMEEIFRGEMDYKVIEMAMDRNRVTIRTPSSIASYNIHGQTFEYVLDMPKILGISLFRNTVAASCKDRKIRVYRSFGCATTLVDSKATGDIVGVHLNANICLAIYSTGNVSAFNVGDGHCFRSFQITDDPLGILTSNCMSEDGCLLYVSERENIRVVDVLRSKLVETINLKSPVVAMEFYKGFLYTVELDKTLSKINVFSGLADSVMIENTPTSLAVKNESVVVSTVKDILIYNLDIGFVNSFQVQLAGRRRDEIFSRGKAVEKIDFNQNYVFCGGFTNQIKIFEQQKEIKLMKNYLFQILKVSRNKDWENYKTKLMKEREGRIEKDKTIDVLKICANDDVVCILATDGLSIYEKTSLQFSPLEFDVVGSKEYVDEEIEKECYHKALMGAMRMSCPDSIKKVIDASNDKNFLVRHIPKQYASVLVEIIIGWLKEDFTRVDYIEMVSELVRFHGISRHGLSKEIQEGTRKIYGNTRRNKYLIDQIFNRTA